MTTPSPPPAERPSAPAPTLDALLAAELPAVAHIERKAAALLLLTVALILGAALYLMYARGVFEPTQSLTLLAEDSEGVSVGMDVTFSGFPIGQVRSLELAQDGNVRIAIDIYQKDAHWLRTSSVFSLVKGLVGGTTIKAYSGILTDPPLPDGAERQVLTGDMTSEIPQIMANARELLGNLAQLTASDAPLQKTLANAQALTHRLNTPAGLPQTLLGGERQAQHLAQTLERSAQLIARLDALVARADTQMLGPQGTVAQINTLLRDTRASLEKFDNILKNTEKITADVSDATTDLHQLRADVQLNLQRIDSLMTEVQGRWPFAQPAQLPLP